MLNEELITFYNAKVRKYPIKEIIQILDVDTFFIGGGSLTREVHDIDVFWPQTHISSLMIQKNLEKNNYPVLASTRNAITTNIGNRIVQFCNYTFPTLEQLVDSFDFAHIQIGVQIGKTCQIEKLYYSQNYEKVRITQNTEYTGSEYPLSSLIRIPKYISRSEFVGKSYYMEIIKILVDIVKRGFTDYNDFKNQLDAVDLGLLPEDYKQMDQGVLVDLFDLLVKEK